MAAMGNTAPRQCSIPALPLPQLSPTVLHPYTERF